jgi:hypothetical protein
MNSSAPAHSVSKVTIEEKLDRLTVVAGICHARYVEKGVAVQKTKTPEEWTEALRQWDLALKLWGQVVCKRAFLLHSSFNPRMALDYLSPFITPYQPLERFPDALIAHAKFLFYNEQADEVVKRLEPLLTEGGLLEKNIEAHRLCARALSQISQSYHEESAKTQH